MSNITAYPLQDWFETTLAQSWNGAVGTVYLNTAPSFTFPSGVKTYIVVNPWKTNMQVGEIDSLHVWNKTVNVSSISVGSWAGTTYTQESHSVWSTVIISDNYQFWKNIIDAVNSKMDLSGGTFTGDVSFSWTGTEFRLPNLTTAERLALTPWNGTIVYDSTLWENYQYIAWAWNAFAAWSTQPNASTTVAGKVEIATSAESIAGTDTGWTGAALLALPSDIAKNIQSSTFIYGADVGGDDTYVVALTPALTTYTVGQILTFKATTANTGACTVDFWPWAKSIKTEDGNDPWNGEIRAGGVNIVQYDGTNFVLHATPTFTPTSNIFQQAIYGETITAADILQYQDNWKVYKWDWYASVASNWITWSYTNKAAMCFIDTDKVVVVYKPSGAWQILYCKVWTISGETVTRWAQTQLDPSIIWSTDQREICKHATNAFTVACWDSTTLKAIAVTVSGTTPTVWSPVTVNSVTTNTLQTSVDICSPDTWKICIAYICGAASAWINGRVATISGTTMSFGTEVVALASNGAWASCCKLDTDKVLLWGVGTGSDIVSYVGTISGTTISFGAQAITAWTCTNSWFMQVDTNIAVIWYSDTNLKAMYVTSSGTANTHRTAVTISTALWATYKKSCMLWTGQIVFVSDTDNLIYTAKDTTNYTFDILNTIDYWAKASLNIDMRYATIEQYTLNRVFVCSFDSVWSTNNAYFLNNNVRYLYGVAQESGVLDEVKKVAIPWNITTVNSGLLTGEKYYTTLTGWYTLNPTTQSTGAYIGKALSATSMLVWINNSTL